MPSTFFQSGYERPRFAYISDQGGLLYRQTWRRGIRGEDQHPPRPGPDDHWHVRLEAVISGKVKAFGVFTDANQLQTFIHVLGAAREAMCVTKSPVFCSTEALRISTRPALLQPKPCERAANRQNNDQNADQAGNVG
jgi:hypothetical protein